MRTPVLKKYDKLFAATVIVLLGLITVLSPFPDLPRLGVMLTLCTASFVAERIL